MAAPRRIMALCCAVALAACAPGFVRGPLPDRAAPPPSVPFPEARSEASLALEQYYNRVQASFLTRGLLRDDGGGIDTPFTSEMLTENFMQIALFEEYRVQGGRLVPLQTESTLRRWGGPVRLAVEFGPTVDPDIQTRDLAEIERYVARLARVTGLPIRRSQAGANYHVLIVNENELSRIGPRIRDLIPNISDAAIDTVQNLPRSSYCLVFASNPSNTGLYDRAVAVIRAEHPNLMRQSCIHEELAQGLGLANDSPRARPSIFNDDEEFGLLTRHDELLLQILYDPRLRPGMTADEARPIVSRIARELVGGPS